MKPILTGFVALLSFTVTQTALSQITPIRTDPQAGTNPKEVTAYQIDPITVDGDFSDWPSGIEERVIGEYLSGFGYQQESRAQGTQDNWFKVAWNDAANQIYISGWSSDDVNVTQLSKWYNPDTLAPAGAPWLHDRWEMYFEHDNSDTGAYGYGIDTGDPGNVQYVVAANDPGRADLYGQDTGADGLPTETGTAFFISNFETVDFSADGKPPFSQGVFIVELENSSMPAGAYTKRFEAAITLLNFFEAGLEPDLTTDVVDLGPNINGGIGIGFDITMMDRDGVIDDSIPDDILFLSADNEGAWIGWSDGSKNANPQFDGTMFFTLEAPSGGSPVKSWEIY